ncbi:MAG: hypothetical protein JWO80_2943 [Bryobacterales bacterium]|nr:hypothetical protein [Bryobacterales bacterium]
MLNLHPSRILIAAPVIAGTLLLAGCPLTRPKVTPSISIYNREFASPSGGVTFLIQGHGFSPNGRVDLSDLNVPPDAIVRKQLSNGASLPSLAADASGNFSGFTFFQDCPYPNPVAHENDGPFDVVLFAEDVNTLTAAAVVVPRIDFCTDGGPVPPALCPPKSTDPRCTKK